MSRATVVGGVIVVAVMVAAVVAATAVAVERKKLCYTHRGCSRGGCDHA